MATNSNEVIYSTSVKQVTARFPTNLPKCVPVPLLLLIARSQNDKDLHSRVFFNLELSWL